MKESKISVAEIAQLRQAAVKEREIRQKIKTEINGLKQGKDISEEVQMQILERGNEEEITPMLDAYAKAGKRVYTNIPIVMSIKAQLYIYENWQTGPYHKWYTFMLKEVPYTIRLAVRCIKDEKFCAEQKLPSVVHRYYLKHMLHHPKCYEAIRGKSFFLAFFNNIIQYFQKYDLCETAEVYLIKKYLNPEPLSDSYIDSCKYVVEKYILCKKQLTLAGEKALIASGHHNLIMMYITIAKEGLKAETELFARGNREEVTAYFKRYATL
ncbi:MAG: hypothetical protein NC218_04605 [Acetobacter sp.]|nr:hypothetical protein [Acetobacter sp.]